MYSSRLVKHCSQTGAMFSAALLACFLSFAVMVVPLYAKKVESFDTYVTSPVRLAFSHNGELLLTDYQSQSILIVDPLTQAVKRRIMINGRPSGVNADRQWIYVGNETSRSVEMYARNGKLQTSLGSADIGLPNDIAVDHTTGQVFVVDAEAKYVRVFNPQGQEVGSIPASDASQLLSYPTAMTIDQNAQLVYISDQGPSVNSIGFRNRSARVLIYRYDGTYVDTLSGAFTRPQGLTINPEGYLYLADGMRGQVLVFDLLSKNLIKTIGSPGTGSGQLSLPLDVAIHVDTGDLWVANNRAGRLERFPRGGITP